MEGTAGRYRAVRAALFSALCVTLSAASHVLLSHVPLPLFTVAAVAGAFFTLAYALAGRERGYGAIAALLVPLELAADTLFTTGQDACYGPAKGPLAGPLHSMGVDLVCRGDVGGPLAPGTYQGFLGGPAAPWLLLAAHVAVGLLAAAWLRRGEAALGGLLRTLAAVAFRPLLLLALAALRAPVRPARPRPRPRRATGPTRPLPSLTHSVVRRGPPSCRAHA
ncbi:hypothetical protein GCM10010218_10550 [Streptomyces mashuensis]|uniref:Integral membrane protein n=1 Tax=Streptomyces mashuensis TaxID=33904 RepID=A0A919AY86_9ACTN|nr:hypothetical protein [Streptomyces mashuensis]GHF31607.1 hypothetical protein GCM10010218_10550 [Streptomyces mashuensis]